jgi:hypothetical protein
MFVTICPPHLLAMAAKIRSVPTRTTPRMAPKLRATLSQTHLGGALIDLPTTKEAAALAGTVRDGIYL